MFTPRPGWFEYLPAQPALSRLGQSQLLEEARELDEGLRRSLGWTLLLADRDADGAEPLVDRTTISSYQYTAIGFVDGVVDQLHRDYPPLGVILYAESEESPTYCPGQLGEVAVAGLTFPIVLRRGTYEQHIGPLRRVPGGSAAYWAESRGGACEGWLTARHVTETIAFSNSSYRAVDRGSSCIDAAVISDGSSRPGGLRPQSAHQAITAGLTVSMACNPGASPSVLDVSSNIRISESSRFPLRFSLSETGRPGDSGSAIEETSSTQQLPLGIYLGSYLPDKAYPGHTGRAGFGLSISQLKKLDETGGVSMTGDAPQTSRGQLPLLILEEQEISIATAEPADQVQEERALRGKGVRHASRAPHGGLACLDVAKLLHSQLAETKQKVEGLLAGSVDHSIGGMQLKEIEVSLGISASGTIGVVSAGDYRFDLAHLFQGLEQDEE